MNSKELERLHRS